MSSGETHFSLWLTWLKWVFILGCQPIR